jgi:precorrin-3B synthase
VLADASADIRLERDVTGRLILRPDGHPFGRLVTDLDADIRALVTWFLASGGMTEGRGRMAPHLARASLPQGFTVPPATPLPRPRPGPHPEGALVAFAFGQIGADTFGALAARGHALRLTPWRMILIAGLPGLPDDPALITRPDDPLLRVAACTGAPGCPQALGPTRGLARTLARTLAGTLARTLAAEAGHPLHVSGCAKGCAHPGPAETTLVATPRGYDIIRGGCASDAPHLTDQPPHLIAAALKARHAP